MTKDKFMVKYDSKNTGLFDQPASHNSTAGVYKERFGNFKYSMQSLKMEDFQSNDTGWQVICREGMLVDGNYHKPKAISSPVSMNYHPLLPEQAISLIDKALGNVNFKTPFPVSRMWMLRGGKLLMIEYSASDSSISGFRSMTVGNTTVLPSMYIIIPMDGKTAIQQTLRAVNLSCVNQLSMIMASSAAHFRATHHPDAPQKLFEHLRAAIAKIPDNIERNEALFNQLWNKPMRTALQATQVLYPVPKKPRLITKYKSSNEQLVEAWEKKRESVLKHQSEIMRLFQGDGIDLHDKGTAWEYYQAVTEYETHRKHSGEQAYTLAMHTGSRRAVLDRALELVLA